MSPAPDDVTLDELQDRAREAGISGFSSMSKDELADALSAKETEAAGPIVPEGETEPQPPKPSGTPVKGVQPQSADDIPEGGK